MNALSTKDLKNLFKLRRGTPSDTHDKLRCERCQTISDDADQNAMDALPKKLASCLTLIEAMVAHSDAEMFTTPLKPEDYDVTSEEYDKAVKQPIDLGTIQTKLSTTSSIGTSYKNPSEFSKDVNRIFTNVMKVWEPGHELADAARRLQSWWMAEWTNLVPMLMTMKADACQDKENIEPDSIGDQALLQNERGDNFQEQIGMPDEENMRHWSHHHASDTVDDPVFRAAMRGYDTVSFVFGLEVTWSLIQQRQQEEEEKQAMLELERIQRIEEETLEAVGCEKDEDETIAALDDNDNKNTEIKMSILDDITSDKNQRSPTVAQDTERSDKKEDRVIWTLSKVFSVEELRSSLHQTCDSEDCNKVACSAWKSGKGEIFHTCLICQEDAYGGWPTCGLGPEDEGHRLCIQSICGEESTMIDTPQDIPLESCKNTTPHVMISELPSPKKLSSPSDWACHQCTFVNKRSSKKCKICHTKKY